MWINYKLLKNGKHMYNWKAKNSSCDLIYETRLRLVRKMKFNYKLTAKRYSYYMNAYLGIILH